MPQHTGSSGESCRLHTTPPGRQEGSRNLFCWGRKPHGSGIVGIRPKVYHVLGTFCLIAFKTFKSPSEYVLQMRKSWLREAEWSPEVTQLLSGRARIWFQHAVESLNMWLRR